MRAKDHMKLLIGSSYFPLKYDSYTFRQQLSDLGNVLNDEDCRIIIVGDFNLPGLEGNAGGGALHDLGSKEGSMQEFDSLLNLTQPNFMVNLGGHILDLALSHFSFSERLNPAEPLVPRDVWQASLLISFSFSSV
ncbi:hypothetical protein HPB48_001680 [Haemaphysalis longicornis]|uniref:Endonuclease/exonuclease/phosphatase domain-containing protein n=1 Tax=Haemaphysalis longicornis TaxID=44386 RepID=A0A9J6FAK2_HAELO|nr:hypothetical protein HPB48_001680 [Haemaphysalis longicornis]